MPTLREVNASHRRHSNDFPVRRMLAGIFFGGLRL
jgi:hypothetical protein